MNIDLLRLLLFGLLWVIVANAAISAYFRWRKKQVEQSLATATVLLSETSVRVRNLAYSFFGFGINWLHGDIYLTNEDIVVIRYYRVRSFIDFPCFYQPHLQVVLGNGQAPPRKGIGSRIVPSEAISSDPSAIVIKANRGIIRSSLRLSVTDPGRWAAAIQSVQADMNSQGAARRA